MFDLKSRLDISTVSVLTGILEVFFVSHTLSQYQQLQYAASQNGYFDGSENQASIYSTIYTIGTACIGLSKIISGILIDIKGFWIARTIFQIPMIAGLLIFIFITPETDWLLYLAVPFFYGGGITAISNYYFITSTKPKIVHY